MSICLCVIRHIVRGWLEFDLKVADEGAFFVYHENFRLDARIVIRC